MARKYSMLQHGVLFLVVCKLVATPAASANATLAASPDSYLEQAARVRQAVDRPWAPDAGQLGNLRHVQINAQDCVVRVVSGTENRVFPGTRNVLIVEQSRKLDANPNEQPVPRDVVLAPDRVQACPGIGSCGVSVTQVAAPHLVSVGVCFTLELASAHDLLIGGDGMDLVLDRVRQPALRVAINPSNRVRVWFDEVDLGLLSIRANAAVHVGGSGKVDFLQLDSSNSASVMYLHEVHAQHVGVSTTTTGTKWSIRIDPGTNAAYYQPARAPGQIAQQYSIEIDGPLAQLKIPAGGVNPLPLSNPTRLAASVLGNLVLTRAGPAAKLPASEANLPSVSDTLSSLPPSARQIVADVAARYLPASIQLSEVALWKDGGRIEGTAPDAASARAVVQKLKDSGEFTQVSMGQPTSRDNAYFFSVLVGFACAAPGRPSVCPPGSAASPGAYSEAQILATLKPLLGATIKVWDVYLVGTTIHLEAEALNEGEAVAALDRLRQYSGMFRLSNSTYNPSRKAVSAISATLELSCAAPPKPNGICAAGTNTTR